MEKEIRPEEVWLSEGEQLQREQEQERDAIMKDPATGVWNPRGLMELGSRLVAQLDRETLPAAVMVADVDDLKGLNDRFGHPAVTELLKKFAEHLTSMARKEDVVARYGGDEFVLVFAAGKKEALDRFKEPFVTEVNGRPLTLTFTAGIVEVNMLHDDKIKFNPDQRLEEAIDRADKILMRAKKINKGTIETK